MGLGLAIGAILAFALLLSPAYAATPVTTFNCTGNHLATNITGLVDGEYAEIYFTNETCPFGCAENGIECNSPLNVDRMSVGLNVAVFMVIALLFLYLSQYLDITRKRFYIMKYFFLGLTFVYLILSVGLIGGMFILGQDNIAGMAWAGWSMLVFSFILAFLVFFFTEVESYIRGLYRAGRI